MSDSKPLKWVDIYDIAAELFEAHPGQNPLEVRFTDLRDLVMGLPAFDDAVERCNEKVLEAIQMEWLEEFQGQ